jgi:hypothetical protein
LAPSPAASPRRRSLTLGQFGMYVSVLHDHDDANLKLQPEGPPAPQPAFKLGYNDEKQ